MRTFFLSEDPCRRGKKHIARIWISNDPFQFFKSEMSVKKSLYQTPVTAIILILRVIIFTRRILFFSVVLLLSLSAKTQIIVSGVVYDSTKQYVVPGVIVKSTGGGSTLTDSLGAYHINTSEKDSISFYYGNKPTQKFPVKTISNYNEFDISLRVKVFEKYRVLKEVKVFTKSYRQDSIENRRTFAKYFDYERPTLRTNTVPGTPPGLDINELISMFRFRRNKMNQSFQKRLIAEEQEKYVDYRFNNTLLKRVTGLSGEQLAKYKLLYRPDYEFLVTATELEYYEYLLASAERFKKQEGIN